MTEPQLDPPPLPPQRAPPHGPGEPAVSALSLSHPSLSLLQRAREFQQHDPARGGDFASPPRYGRRKPAPGRALQPALCKDGPAAAFSYRSATDMAGGAKAVAAAAASSKTWLLAAEYERKMDTIKRDFEVKKYFMSEALLSDVYEFMRADGQLTSEEASKAKWEELGWFNQQISRPPHCDVPLGGSPHALYEKWYKAEPRPLCSEPRFLTVIHCVYGFETASIDRVCDSTMLRHLSRLFHSFDISQSSTGHGSGKIDWRSLVFGLRLCQSHTTGLRTALDWGFALYTSEGALHVPTAKRMGMITRSGVREMCSIAGATRSAQQHIRARVNEALAELGNTDFSKPPHLQGKGLLTYDEFSTALTKRPLAQLLEPSDRYRFLVRWEELYNPALRDFINDVRKERYNMEKCRLFSEKMRKRRMWDAFERAFKSWVKRKRMRQLVLAFEARYVFRNTVEAFGRWLRKTMTDVASVDIQRLVRGFIARMYVWWLHVYHDRATLLQRQYRMHMCLVRLRMEKRRRVGAALRIQAYYRARCDRSRARLRLLAKFSKEHDVLVRKRWKLERKRQKYATMHLQRYIRGHFGRMRAHARFEERERARAVQQEMGEEALLWATKLETHIYNMTEAWEKERVAALQAADDAEVTDAEKLKLLRYQRRRVWTEATAKQRAQEEEAAKKEELRAEVWRRKWRKEMDHRGRNELRRVERVLLAPERGSGEKEERAAIRSRIKAKAKEVMAKEEEEGMPCEAAEAEIKALEIVKQEMVEAAQAAVQKEWDAEEEQYQSQKQQESELQELAAEEQRQLDREHLALVVQKLWYAYTARKRSIAQVHAQYEKHYDSERRRQYYVRVHNGEVRWDKHVLLYASDLEYVPIWHLLNDTTFDGKLRHFFYEPRSMQMTWEEPPSDGVRWSEPTEAFVFGEGLLRQKFELHVHRHGDGMRGDELVRQMFYKNDMDHSGYLERPELRIMFDRLLSEGYTAKEGDTRELKRACHHMTDRQLDAIIDRLDDDGDGRVSLEELIDWVQLEPADVDAFDIKLIQSWPVAERYDPAKAKAQADKEVMALFGVLPEEAEAGDGDAGKEGEEEAGDGAQQSAGKEGAGSAGSADTSAGIGDNEAWQLVDNGTGAPYYYNAHTGESSWEKPAAAASIEAAGNSAVAAGPQQWQRVDDGSGQQYWYNTATGQSQWEPPPQYTHGG